MRTALGVAAAVGMVSAAVTLSAVGARGPSGPPAPEGAPTFTRDVAPVLFKHCSGCHRPGEIGPMSLLTYADARPRARAIKQALVGGKMPPWHADAAAGVFENDRRLSDAEKNLVLKWVDSGAPEGDPGELPAAPEYPDGWTIGKPDAVFTMQEDYPIPAKGEIDYEYFEIPTNLTEDKWVEALEVRPGSRAAVHHVLVYSRGPEPEKRSPAFEQPDPQGEIPEGETGNNAAQLGPNPRPAPKRLGALIGLMAPGQTVRVLRPDTAFRLRAGSVLTFQMHYTAMGKATTDRTQIGFKFAAAPPTTELRISAIVNGSLLIPAGASNHSVEADATFLQDVTLYSLLPHTHLRGRSWRYELTYPDGRQEVLLSVPKYDFNWQTDYVFSAPLKLPKGTKLHAVATYDNSRANRSNPDSSKDVRWGDQTWEEMCWTGITFSVDK